jgi:predicted ATP-dependent serine protease
MQDLTRTGGSVLIGREDEVARVEGGLDHPRRSVGEALVISGAAGIGKSALLLHARWGAEAWGISVLSVEGLPRRQRQALGLAEEVERSRTE